MSEFSENNEGASRDIVTLQMLMTNSSFGHEYARKEFESARSYDQKEELLAKMDHFKRIYFEARQTVSYHFPELLEDIEKDLLSQKLAIFSEFNA